MKNTGFSRKITAAASKNTRERDYWLNRLAGEWLKGYFPYDFERTAAGDDSEIPVGTVPFHFPGRVFSRLMQLRNGSDPRLHIILTAGIFLLLERYTGHSDIIVGAPIEKQDIEAQFINTVLVLRSRVEAQMTFKDLVLQVRETIVEAAENMNYSMESIIYQLNLSPSEEEFPLFDAAVLLENIHDKTYLLPVHPNVVFCFHRKEESIEGVLEYNPLLYRKSTAERIVSYFTRLLGEIIFNVDIPVSGLDILSEEETQRLLIEFNRTDTGQEGLEGKTIHGLFEEQVYRAPDHIAVIGKGHRVTYGELDRRANGLAVYLYKEKGIRPDDRVGILMDASLHQVTAVLGVLKAGGAYVPIEPSLPEERVKNILEDAGIGVVISGKTFTRTLNRMQWECGAFHTFLCMDSRDILAEDEVEENRLMDKKLWEYIGSTAVDEITGGGWTTSYTGEPFSKEEMDEYGDNILEKLTPYLHPGTRVLEIGCASGISMFRIAPKVGYYLGTDLSHAIIEKNRKRIKEEGYQNIALKTLPAHEIDIHIPGQGDFDIVIVNSVIQAFHGHNYLRKVIRKSVDLLKEKGILFIGDVMDQELKGDLIREMKAFKRANRDGAYTTKTDFSAELFVSRRFFEDLSVEIPGINGVSFSDKIYTIKNELTKFRFDALLTIDKTRKGTARAAVKHKYQEDLTLLERAGTEMNGEIHPAAAPGNMAYLIYTSGSTGMPRGVMVEHRGAVNTLVCRREEYKMDSPDISLQLFSYAFDGFVTSFFTPVVSGAGVVLPGNRETGDTAVLKRIILKYCITHLISVPALYGALVENFKRGETLPLKVITLAGDKVLPSLLEKSLEKSKDIEIANEYGITEVSVMSTIYRHQQRDSRAKIGRPIWNTKIYIIDQQGRLKPVGVPGELCIAGTGIARGYLNNPEMTNSKFQIPNYKSQIPNSPTHPLTHSPIYKTGDLARWLEDGNIEFLGRIDHQVKIRGFRIELGEIESQLKTHDEVKEAVVTVREEKNREKYLCAYLIARGVDTPDSTEIKDYLSGTLPAYMIPAYFVVMDRIPLTSSGKVDRKALPEPRTGGTGQNYRPPRDMVEETLTGIWADVLGVDKNSIGIEDNFFERGGHSIRAAIVVSRIHKEFNVEFPLSNVFNGPTVKEFAAFINEAKKDIYQGIEPVPVMEYYPQSSAQKRLFFLDRFEDIGTSYNIPFVIEVEGKIDNERFEKTFNALIARHESLRTSFELVDDEAVQRVHEEENSRLQIINYKARRRSAHPFKITNVIKRFIRPFDLSQAPLLRVGLVKLAQEKHLLLFDMHHIIADGTSMQVLVGDFTAFYSGETLPPLRIQYKDFSRWQNRLLQSPEMQAQEDYWLKVFDGEIPALNLPTDFPRPQMQSFAGNRIAFQLDAEETGALKRLALEREVTLFMVLLALYNVLLSRLSGQEDIVVGAPAAGRRHADLEPVIGMFVNTLALRNFPEGGKRFKDFLKEVKSRTLEAFDNQDYQFEDLVEKVPVPRDTGRNPLFDVMFALQNMETPAGSTPGLEIPGLELKPYGYENVTSKFDLNLQAAEVGEGLRFKLEYCTRLFSAATIRRLIRYFRRITESVIAAPGTRLADIEIMTEEEKRALLEMSRGVREEVDETVTIHGWFEKKAEEVPDKAAVVLEDSSLTYHRLNRGANRLARTLRAGGVTSDSVVGLMVKRSFEMVTAVLAVMKAGGAYLPLDEELPAERTRYMLRDSSVSLLLTNLNRQEVGSFVPGDIGVIDITGKGVYGTVAADPIRTASGSNLAYVLYTSGSTGKPKGLMLEHRNLVNLINHHFRHTGIDCSRVLQFSTISFDVSFQEMFSTLLAGGTLYLIARETRTDIPELFGMIERNQIKTLFLPISFLKMVFSEEAYAAAFPGCVSHIQSAGEQVVVAERFRRFLKKNNVCLHNHYGPAETHVVTTFTVDPVKDIPDLPPIGKPIRNTDIYILDKAKHLLPVGVPGELYIAGIQVGRGYLNKPGLTAEKFNRSYKTGDLARWLEDGNIEFLGRIDHQVKIRGFRIEPGEIENQLTAVEYIKDAVVIDRQDEKGEKYLTAYVVSDVDMDPSALGDILSKGLPAYMIPSYFVPLVKIPLTLSGKVDRKVLPGPEVKAGQEYVPPGNELEEKLVELWSEVLRVEKDKIGVHADFFRLGGHSLKAAVLGAKIHRELNVKLPLAEVFKTPTVRGLSEGIKDLKKDKYASIEPAEKREYYALSSAPKRLYILQRMEEDNISYNMPGLFLLGRTIDRDKLEEAFKKIISRHESLRTYFEMVGEEPVQKIHDKVGFEIEELPTPADKGNPIEDFVRPFNLSRAPLLRAGLLNTGEEYLLVLDMHHIVTDGTSQDILKREFMALYDGTGETLPALRLQYRDYCEWLSRPEQQEQLKDQEAYWIGVFSSSGELPVLTLPLDYPRPENQSFAGSRIDFVFQEEETKTVKDISGKAGTTLYMTLLSIFNILLSKLSGLEDIIVGTPIAARRHADLEQVIGMFVNTLAVRNYPSGDKTYKAFLKEVKEQTLKAYENQEYPFETLVDKISVRRDTSRNPVFDVMFNLLNQVDYQGDTGIMTTGGKDYAYENKTSKFDLNLTAVDMGEKLLFSFEYCTRLFREKTIHRIIEYFKKITQLLSKNENREQRLLNIEMITGEERKRLLFEFNDTGADFPADKTVHRLFEEQAAGTPDNIAVVGPLSESMSNASVSFGALNEKANQLAHLLRTKGVGPNIIVGLTVERTIEMIIALLAVLKAGGAYLPIDTEYPESRKTYMIKDSSIKLLLADNDIIPLEVEMVGLRDEVNYRGETGNPVPLNNPADMLYLVYTSGSTGKPKGVILEHRNLVNLLMYEFEFSNLDFGSVLQFAPISFDVSFQEIFSTLLSGGKLYLIRKEMRTDIPRLFEVIEKNQIKTLFLPPSILKVIFSEEDYIEIFPACAAHIAAAGEQVLISDAFRNYLEVNKIFLHNHYGPSEAHVVTALTLHPAGEIPERPSIGKPVSNTGIYILDKYGHLQPVGVPGELYIGGVQVGRGYLNNPQLTAETFTPLPLYSSTPPFTSGGTPAYRTGDLARWLPDGQIEFLGRIDHQVKLRGFRIELGEIERLLLNHENVKEAVVLMKGKETEDKYLCAYIVTTIEDAAGELKEYLAARLPQYMVPVYFITLEKFPLTPTGKIDRKALSDHKEFHPRLPSGEAASVTDMEKIAADTWKEVLHLGQVGIHDNFFEIGGNSISILKVHGKLRKVLKIDIQVVKLFKYPTIHSLALYLENLKKDENFPDKEMTFSAEVKGAKDGVRGAGLETAVIGMAGIFPGAGDIDAFWDNLKNGVESIIFFSEEELEEAGFAPRLVKDANYVKAKGITRDVEYFDAPFFDYTPKEARVMDPQVRLFHQCVWHALEDAGYDPFSYPRRIGLYAGSSPNIYWEMLTMFSIGGGPSGGLQAALLRNKDFMCTRISYKLNLRGPSFNVQTACSTSLAAIHLAIQGLLNGECEMALAGGVTISYPVKSGHMYREGMINSPDGHCRAFDAGSKGIVGGNGAGVVLLKKYEEAVTDRDHIYAIIKGSAVNNDGIRKVGYTAPSVEGQAEVIRAAQYMAGAAPETITYVETHGTGTELGDPVEVEALKLAFNTTKKGFCGIGSVKTNIGHLDAAAGAASFIKTVLAIKHRLIPPTLHFKTPNPKLGLEDSPFYVVSKLTEWKGNGCPLRAGVSSLGIGGTNAHVVLEEWPGGHSPGAERRAHGAEREYQLILLSAKTSSVLDKMTENLANYLKNNPVHPANPLNPVLPHIAYTLQVGRRAFQYRRMMVCSSANDAVSALSTHSRKAQTGFSKGEKRPVIFVFCGQGSQYVNMGRELYEKEPVFRKEMDRCFEIAAPMLGGPVKNILYPDPSVRPERFNRTKIIQTLLFIFEYALAKMLMEWGIKPAAMIGYSLGEYIAACISGVLSLEDALKLVFSRGQLIEQTPPGAMVSVPLPAKDIKPLLDNNKDISLAVVNGPSCVAAGSAEAVDVFEEEMKTRRLLCTRINISHAVHSALMNPIREAFEKEIKEFTFNKPRIPFISNVSGHWISADDAANPGYWGEQMCAPVRFSDGLKELLKKDNAVFIEIGPGRVLSNLVRQHPGKRPGQMVMNLVRHQQENIPDEYLLLSKIGQLWLFGVSIDWWAFYREEERYRVPLPTYPFEKRRYWFDGDVFQKVTEMQFRPGDGYDDEPEPTPEPEQSPAITPDEYEYETGEEYAAPRDELDQNIAQIWQDQLGFKKIGIYDNFFRLNGDSLTATQVVSRIKEMYPVEVTLHDFFEEPTIAHLAEVIKKLLIVKIKNLSPGERKRLASK